MNVVFSGDLSTTGNSPARFRAPTGRMSVGLQFDAPFTRFIDDFYQTNPVARASAVMTELSALARSNEEGATGTHG